MTELFPCPICCARGKTNDGVKQILASENKNRPHHMIELLKGRSFSIIHDSWTSSQNLSYRAVTIHFIDDTWTLHHHPLACTVNERRSTAKCIYEQLRKVRKDYDLDLHSLTGCAADTESVMQSVAKLFKTDNHNLSRFLKKIPPTFHMRVCIFLIAYCYDVGGTMIKDDLLIVGIEKFCNWLHNWFCIGCASC